MKLFHWLAALFLAVAPAAQAQISVTLPMPHSATILRRVTGVTYDTDASAYFAQMTVQPDATRKGLINDFVVGLKADGVWSRMKRMSVLALGTSQAALLDIVFPATKHINAINSPTFTTDRGFAGDGATSYLDIGEGLAATGASQNDLAYGFWTNTSSAKSGSVNAMGANAAGATMLWQATNTNGSGDLARCGEGTVGTNHTSTGTRLGYRSCSRVSSSTLTFYFNGASAGAITLTSTSPITANIVMMQAANSGYDDDRFAFYFVSLSLTDAQQTALYNRVNTLLTAIGAN